MKKFIAILAVLCLAASCSAFAQDEGGGEFLRGVWVSSVANLDYPSKSGLSDYQLKAEADKIISSCAEMGMNAIFLQVRPCADALYNSSIFPKSVFLTGKSSYESLSFDPLAYFVSEAHKRNIQVHAWLNPYRVTRLGEKEYSAFSPDSPQRRHPEYLLKASDGNYFFNPALQEVRDLITSGVTEIIQNYDVDGIHFDDYFYPEGSYDDSAQFNASGSGDVNAWRLENVNALVRQVHDAVKALDPSISFGISPRGVWANNYEDARGSATRGGGSLNSVYCDSLRFIGEGWVDYICPQIYWSIGFSAADYSILVPWWSKAVRGTNVKLYIGMADYRAADAAADSPWRGTDELARQINLNKSYAEIGGEVHFRYGAIAESPSLKAFYKRTYGGSSSSFPSVGEGSAAEKMKGNLLMLMRKITTGV